MQRRQVGTTLLLLAILQAACGGGTPDAIDPAASAELEASSGVRGVATDASSGAPLAGVAVSDGQKTVLTSSTGAYQLSERAGTVTLTAALKGYASATQQVTVPRRGYATADWRLAALVCTYTYSAWGACQPDGTQTRTVLSASPDACKGTPVLSQACTYVPPPTASGYRVFANNDLGMHCVDKSFAVFSILPPYNVVDAQVVALQSSGKPIVLDASQVDVRYSAVADATGSINSTSLGKSDFWTYAAALYGAPLAPGQGLMGLWMPADAPTAAGRTLSWDAALGLFKAPGVPIFPTDDAGKVNPYPLMRFSAYAKTGALLAASDTVLPVSDETSCQNCHATGKVAATGGSIAWSTDADLEAQSRRNVLLLHNARLGTNLQAPVLCAACHYSPALDLAGTGPSAVQAANATMSAAMHAFHAGKMAGLADAPVAVGGTVPSPATQSCYQCHPGAKTQCLRGAMTSKVDCQNCHGGMAAVGGQYPLLAGGSIDGTNTGKPRRPWLDLPRCGSCHANDAVAKTTLADPPELAADGLRFNTAFATDDLSASPIAPQNLRFAEQAGKLFRKSKGHGGMACEACHGSTHAIWSAGPNDNVEAASLQGHAGTIAECSACHLSPPTAGLGGPHGMHPVGSAWVNAHGNFGEHDLASCTPCHGTDYRGTALSRTFAARTLAGHALAAGTPVGCYTCHNGPRG